MPREEFEKLVAEEFPHAIPEKFRDKIANVAFLVEGDPSPALRMEERLGPHMTLLGHYRGIPQTSRGNYYGVGNTLPDTIILFQNPIEAVARGPERTLEISPGYIDSLRKVIRDTIWHEVAHHFGMNEREVRVREQERKRKNSI